MKGLKRLATIAATCLAAAFFLIACGSPLAPIKPTPIAPGETVSGSVNVTEKLPGGEIGQAPFAPDVEEIEPSSRRPVFVDDSVRVDYASAALKVANGKFDTVQGQGSFADYKSYTRDALVSFVDGSKPFAFGTVEFDLRTNTTADSGVIFGVTTPVDLFWEGRGVTYYFYFFNHEGYAYLGKCDNGGWWVIKQVPYGYNGVDTYRMKVVYEGNKICCYVNGKLVIAYRDHAHFKGTGWGFRTNEIGVTFSNIAVTSDYLYGEE
ncbi:MAG: hypothetical protein IJW89_06145 [Clostridia bacterium]|nr:hypothetical protein [Clostridia bacterium]